MVEAGGERDCRVIIGSGCVTAVNDSACCGYFILLAVIEAR